jgi:FkbM family methyltransferase
LTVNHPRDIAGIVEVYVLDVYHAGLLRRGDNVLDVGAGIGDFSVRAARAVGPEGLVMSVEPNPEDFETLQRNVENNGLRNVVAVNAALGKDSGTVELEFKGSTFRSEVRTLASLMDQITREHGGRRIDPDFVKMDIEGAEARALEGMTQSLGRVRAIAIELHASRAEVELILGPLGFRFVPLTRAHYLTKSVAFAARNPLRALAIWHILGSTGQRPPIGRIFRGIEIVKGSSLHVGVYSRLPVDCEPEGPGLHQPKGQS